jgi:hypothetical protein
MGGKEKARERERGSAMACVKDTAKDSGLMTPPNSQISLGMDEAVKSLISPPPEDVLERIHSVSGLPHSLTLDLASFRGTTQTPSPLPSIHRRSGKDQQLRSQMH